MPTYRHTGDTPHTFDGTDGEPYVEVLRFDPEPLEGDPHEGRTVHHLTLEAGAVIDLAEAVNHPLLEQVDP